MRAIRVHHIDQARAAVAAARDLGRGVTLLSPVALQCGIGWWRALVRIVQTEFPEVTLETVLDCGPSAGLALTAIRGGAGPVMLDVPELFAKIADIAQQAGTRAIDGGTIVALDLLGVSDMTQACRDWLEAEDAAPAA